MSRRFAAAASIAFVLALAILIVDQTFLFRNLDRLIASLFVLSGMLTLATIIGTAYERGRVPRLMMSAIWAIIPALVAWLLFVVTGTPGSPWSQVVVLAIVVLPTSWVVTCAAVAFVVIPRARNGWGVLVRALGVSVAIGGGIYGTVAVALLPAASAGALVMRASRYEDRAAELGLAIGVIYAGLLGGAWVLSHMAQIAGTPTADDGLPFTFTCPRCGEKSSGATGGTSCDACGLVLKVELA